MLLSTMTSPWSEARAAMMLDPGAINLNTGSFGPWPRKVFERVTALRAWLAAEPMDFLLRMAPPLLWQARTRLAEFVGGDPRRLVFTSNVSAGINLVAASLRLAAPGEILMTDHEYGAMQWCWERAAQRQGLTLRTFALPPRPESAGEVIAACCAAMSDRTRLLFFSHVLSPTGAVLPAGQLCAEARRRGILTVVDGAHAPAFVPLDLEAVNSDFYGANCHKWLLAPTGAGFLYLGKDSLDRLQPLHVSWGWKRGHAGLDDRDEFGSTPRLRQLEFEGTRDPSAWLTIPDAIDFQAGLGWQRIRDRIGELTRHVRRRLGDELGLPLATPENPAMCGPLTAVGLPAAIDPVELRRRLWEEYRIEIAVTERPAPDGAAETAARQRLLRVSTHFYNTPEEVDRLAEAMTDWCHRD